MYVYPIIRDDTAPMMKFPLHTRMDVKFLQDTFGRFMVKDYMNLYIGISMNKMLILFVSKSQDKSI